MLNQDIILTALSSPNNKVDIKIAGQSISNIVGPTPMVDFSTTYDNADGFLSTVIDTISINGKIMERPSTTGSSLSAIIEKMKTLKSGVLECLTTFEIVCENSSIYFTSGLLVKQFNINRTDNNWTKSADFTIELEGRTNKDGQQKTVEDQSESWSIEQIEDSQFTSFQHPYYGGSETLNPAMGAYPGGQPFGTPHQASDYNNPSVSTIGINMLPQYRVTRRLSARGLYAVQGTGTVCLPSRESTNIIRTNNAKQWVETRASGLNLSSNSFFHIPSTLTSNSNNTNGMHLYNHIRSISLDNYNGTYEMTDNWLVMPSAIGHTESFTIDSSTSENFTKTVRIAGTVNGLALYSHSNKTNTPMVLYDTSGASPGGTGTFSMNDAHGLSNLEGSKNLSSPNLLSNTKYSNAKRAWETQIKPMAYRRACLGMSQNQKISRLATNSVDPTKPNNPNYYYDRPLNVIPVTSSESHNPMTGAITYNMEFSNRARALPGVLSENINITHDAPSDSISETNVLGRALGPIIQKFGRTNARKTITIDIIVEPPQTIAGTLQDIPNGYASSDSPVGLGTDLRRAINLLIQGHAPYHSRDSYFFGPVSSQNSIYQLPGKNRPAQYGTVFVQNNQETWNPTEGRFSKTVSWIYQPCSTTNNSADAFWLQY